MATALEPTTRDHDELHDLGIKHEALEQKYNTIELENKEYKHLIEELQHQNDELKQELSHLHERHQQQHSVLKPLVEDHLSSMQSSLVETDAQIQELLDELNLKNAEIRQLNREMSRLQTQNEKMSAALESHHQQKAMIKQNLQELRDSSSCLHQENSQLRDELHQLKQVRFKPPKCLSPRSPPSIASITAPQFEQHTKRYSMLNIDASELPSVSPYLNGAWTVSKSTEPAVMMMSKGGTLRQSLRDLGLDMCPETDELQSLQSPRFDVECMYDELTELRAKCEHLVQRLSKYEGVEEVALSASAVITAAGRVNDGGDDEKCGDADNDAPYAFIDNGSSDDDADDWDAESMAGEDEEKERQEMEGLFEKCQGEILQLESSDLDAWKQYESQLIEKFRILHWEFQLRRAYVAKREHARSEQI